MRYRSGARGRIGLAVMLLAVLGAAVVTAAASAGGSASTIKVGLITKDVTNPFFVKMKQGATAQAKKLGAQLLYAAGKSSSDNRSPRSRTR
jgi:fructose transport system substrate-binding protein